MTRPESHREPDGQRCGNCWNAKKVGYSQRLLCFHGEHVKVGYGYFALNWKEVDISSEAYDKLWDDRVVDPSDTCDKWSPEE